MLDAKDISNLPTPNDTNVKLDMIEIGTTISIKFGIEDDFVLITVNDNGTGIDKSIISHITEPYYTTKVGNSGLGLAITKKIIDDHNGTMLIKPLKRTKGTSVIFKFPLISKIKKEKK